MKHKEKGAGRDAGQFMALPYPMLDSPAFRGLSVHARALLLDIARQFNGSNNGSLLCSRRKMLELGWRSVDMLTKSKAELLEARLLFQTVAGQRPNKASWYAVTWLALSKSDAYDPGTVETFRRGMYRAEQFSPRPTRDELYRRWDSPAKTQGLDRPTVQEVPA